MPKSEPTLEQSYDDIADTIDDEFQPPMEQCTEGRTENAGSEGTCAVHVTAPQPAPQPIPQKGLTAWLLHMQNKQARSQRQNTLVGVANTLRPLEPQ